MRKIEQNWPENQLDKRKNRAKAWTDVNLVESSQIFPSLPSFLCKRSSNKTNTKHGQNRKAFAAAL